MATRTAPEPSAVDVKFAGVTKYYGEVKAVDDITFDIGKGKFFSFLGPSGCGKTTTLRMLGGFIDPDQGEVWIGGHLANGIPPSQRETNMVFQHLALFPHMNVFDNIAFGLRMKGVGRSEIQSRVLDMLRLVRLQGFENRRVRQLSGGQQQRVAIARALVNGPRVLLLDEPLGALDLQLRFEMQQELKRVQREVGTTFVYVTHDQGEALTMSDGIAVMNNGRLIQVGSPREIYEEPKTAFVAKFIGNTNLIQAELLSLERGGQGVARAGNILIRGHVSEVRNPGPVEISLRPEKVGLGPKARDAENHYSGRVQQATFKGTFFEYRVAIEQGPTIDAIVPNDGSGPQLAVSSTTDVGWSVSCATILSE